MNRTDVVNAIEYCKAKYGIKLSTGNPANFMKDVVRGDNASDMWPERLTRIGITARQRPSGQRVFEFVKFATGQTEPFPNKYTPHADLQSTPVEAVRLLSDAA